MKLPKKLRCFVWKKNKIKRNLNLIEKCRSIFLLFFLYGREICAEWLWNWQCTRLFFARVMLCKIFAFLFYCFLAEVWATFQTTKVSSGNSKFFQKFPLKYFYKLQFCDQWKIWNIIFTSHSRHTKWKLQIFPPS